MKLPPLNAIKAFEAAARTGSFVQAAHELGVSSAAVSMQVRNLETFLNKKLFIRSNNRIALTDAGAAVYPGSAAALNGIAAITERILEGDAQAKLVISTLPSLAERWLAPRLAEFTRLQPGMGMEIRTEDDPVDFAGDRIDLRITYGDRLYQEFRSFPLFTDEVTPLHAPGFPASFGSDGGLMPVPDEHLIHVEWGETYASHPGWSEWFRSAGMTHRHVVAKGIKVAAPSLAIALAVRGIGMVLGQKTLANTELAAGLLIAPSPVVLRLPQPYCAISPHAKSTNRAVSRLLEWLTAKPD